MNRLFAATVAATFLVTTAGLAAAVLAQPVNSADAGLPALPPVGLTRAQVQSRVQERFVAVDADHDGAITMAELDAYRAKARDDRMAAREAARAARHNALFTMLDTNRDGQLSRAEFAARPAPRPDGGDRDGPPMEAPDGIRGRDGARGHDRMGGHGPMAGAGFEGRGAWGGFLGPDGDRRAPAFFASMDTNKDGRVTLAEASARPLARFDAADTNKDGILTTEERRASAGRRR